MSFDEFKMQGQNTSGIKQLLGKHIGYISKIMLKVLMNILG